MDKIALWCGHVTTGQYETVKEDLKSMSAENESKLELNTRQMNAARRDWITEMKAHGKSHRALDLYRVYAEKLVERKSLENKRNLYKKSTDAVNKTVHLHKEAKAMTNVAAVVATAAGQNGSKIAQSVERIEGAGDVIADVNEIADNINLTVLTDTPAELPEQNETDTDSLLMDAMSAAYAEIVTNELPVAPKSKVKSSSSVSTTMVRDDAAYESESVHFDVSDPLFSKLDASPVQSNSPALANKSAPSPIVLKTLIAVPPL